VTAGVRERAANERRLELAQQPVAHVALAVRERLRELAVERVLPARIGACGFGGARVAHVGRQIADVDPLSGRHHRQPMADVLELPHVAWERKFGERLERRFRQRLRINGELARALLQEVTRERRDVLGPLAQRRQAQANDVEPVQQVLAEESLAHALVEVLVRRRDDAYGRTLRRVSADAVVLAVRQHAQKPHLQVGRHVADFVQEQRAAFRLLEAAATLSLRAGEGAALVPEQLRFQQVFRNRRRVDRDERPGRARAVPMERARDEFLAGA